MWVIIFVLILLVAAGIFYNDTVMHRSHKTYSNGIVNHDAGMREFCYRIDKGEHEIWNMLRGHNAYAVIKYRLNREQRTITFYSELPSGQLDISYAISVSGCKDYTLLRVKQLDHLYEKNTFALLQNAFWYQKLGAEPIPHIKIPSISEGKSYAN